MNVADCRALFEAIVGPDGADPLSIPPLEQPGAAPRPAGGAPVRAWPLWEGPPAGILTRYADERDVYRAWALIDHRDLVLPEDIQAVLPAIAGHRLRPASGLQTASSADIATALIAAVPLP